MAGTGNESDVGKEIGTGRGRAQRLAFKASLLRSSDPLTSILVVSRNGLLCSIARWKTKETDEYRVLGRTMERDWLVIWAGPWPVCVAPTSHVA